MFGQRLASHLATWPDVTLVVAARRREPLERLRQSLTERGAANPIEIAVVDREAPDGLAALAPWAVVDCAGPFQPSDHRLALAALRASAHYMDLADGRAFVAGFVAALNAPARLAGRCAVTAASSSPALSHAAIAEIARGWKRIDRIEVAISPGARAPRGASVVQSILSWTGQPVRVFLGGEWRARPGWSLLRRRSMRGLGHRWLALAETPDLDVQVERFHPRREALFLAGLELAPEHFSLWALSWLVRLGLLSSLEPLSPVLPRLSAWMAPLGSDRGGMIVSAEGLGSDGAPVCGAWSLWAERGVGPVVPTLPAAALLRTWLEGEPPSLGAHVCAGLLDLKAIMQEAEDLPIRTALRSSAPNSPSLGRRLMEAAFDDLPAAVRAVHAGNSAARFTGRARARGGKGLAALARLATGMPGPGRYETIAVRIEPDERGETWRRQFGARRFRSRLCGVLGHIGGFEEHVGPASFRFEADPTRMGFTWRFVGWRLGPLPLPRALAPHISARCFERASRYHFSVAVAHPWVGLILAYAGQLEVS